MIHRTLLFSIPVHCYWDGCPVVWHEHHVYQAAGEYILIEYAEGSPRTITQEEVEALRDLIPQRQRERAEYHAERMRAQMQGGKA